MILLPCFSWSDGSWPLVDANDSSSLLQLVSGSWPLVDTNDSSSLLQLVRWFMAFDRC